MGAKNQFIAGNYIGTHITAINGCPQFKDPREGTTVMLDFVEVESVQVVSEEQSKSAVSGAIRGMVGGAIFGTAGMLAGSMSAKNKGVYQLAINFKNGKRSLAEVDEKIYKAIMTSCF